MNLRVGLGQSYCLVVHYGIPIEVNIGLTWSCTSETVIGSGYKEAWENRESAFGTKDNSNRRPPLLDGSKPSLCSRIPSNLSSLKLLLL